MKHKVEVVEDLLNSSKELLENLTNGGENSATAILNKLDSAYTTLTNCWKGIDAGVQIGNLVKVFNDMVTFRNNMSELAIYTYGIGIYYRQIQSSNGASIEIPSPLTDEVTFSLKGDYTDTEDTVNISTAEANIAKDNLTTAQNYFAELTTAFSTNKSAIFSNWTLGEKHDEYEAEFDNFEAKFKNYENIIDEINEAINSAITNYGG